MIKFIFDGEIKRCEAAIAVVDMRDDIRNFQEMPHGTSDLERAAGRSNMDEEYNRYDNGRSAVAGVQGYASRRARHLSRVASSFTGALGDRASTDGQDRY